ncbi:MAG: hypothetical protein FJ278_23640 [Planctomycetes bacterium]|nr:hypothetical protein [Planctomycetota bacterium]
MNKHRPEIVPVIPRMADVRQVSFVACAGINEPLTKCVWEPHRKAFVLCIGNNDIAPDGEGCRTVRKLGIKVEEAETSKSVARYARDCTCGIVFFQ